MIDGMTYDSFDEVSLEFLEEELSKRFVIIHFSRPLSLKRRLMQNAKPGIKALPSAGVVIAVPDNKEQSQLILRGGSDEWYLQLDHPELLDGADNSSNTNDLDILAA